MLRIWLRQNMDVYWYELQLNKSFIKALTEPDSSVLSLKPHNEEQHYNNTYHDSVGEIAIGLSLQTHSGELSCHIALWGGFVQGGLLDTSHLSDHEEGQHALQEDKGKHVRCANKTENLLGQLINIIWIKQVPCSSLS